MRAFNNERYLGAQIESFVQRLNSVPVGGRAIIEFGGKPIDDQHAARVLPGFDPDIKIELLHQLLLVSDLHVVVAVSARDLLRPRIRGDSQLFYGSETIRVIRLLQAKGLHIDTGVVTMVNPELSPSQRAVIDQFHSDAVSELGIHFREDQLILQYPDIQAAKWDRWGSVNGFGDERHHVLVLSPGGGSGKFGLCVAELYRDYRAGRNSTFMKYETFPVFGLRPEHPVNRAFIAATADLGNTLSIETQTGLTCYDKEVGNFALLQRIHQAYCPDRTTNPITQFAAPSSMSVNCLLDGFDDEFAIASAARTEIERRAERYRSEIARGIESVSTINHLTTFAAE
jgi:uncharacterized protein (UPF0371 family)